MTEDVKRDVAGNKEQQQEQENEIVFTSQLASVPVPSNIGLHEFMLEHVDDNPEEVAIVDAMDGRQYTYSQVQLLSRNVAAGLIKHFNIRKGEVVCVLLPNVAEFPILMLGIITAGAVYTGANPFSHPQELQHQIQESDAKLVITHTLAYPKLQHLSSLLPILLLDYDSNPTPTAFPCSLLFQTDCSTVSLPRIFQDDLCALPFSSGTTGLPKGVMHTHRSMIANMCSLGFDLGNLKPGENVALAILPFFHLFGNLWQCCITLRTQGKVVVLARFEVGSFMKALMEYEVKYVAVVPAIIHTLVQDPRVEEYDLSKLKLRSILCAGASLPTHLQDSFLHKFSGVLILEGYGLTEHGCITFSRCSPWHCSPCHSRGNAKKGAVGFILPNREVKFVDLETSKSVPRNTLGELCVRSQCNAKGYVKNPEATKYTFDTKGWLHTGDVGYIDEDGDIFIVDRMKELIKFKGFQVPPAELEGILISHLDIIDAAVVPLPDEVAGEIPVACVVRTQGSSLTEDEVIKFVESKVASYKKVRKVSFVQSIPKTPTGKILRKEVKESLLKCL